MNSPILWETNRGNVEHDVNLSPQALVDRHATIRENSEVWGQPRVTGKSELSQGAVMTGSSHCHNSHLLGAQMHDQSMAVDSALVGNVWLFDQCFVDRSFARGLVRIGGNAILEDVHIDGQATILGGIIQHCRLSSGVRITGGRWNRSPRVVDLRFIVVCEGEPGFTFLDCRRWGTALILKAGPRLGRMLGFSEDQVSMIRKAILQVSS